MTSKKLIFFIGMPGAGKTYWGTHVAAGCGLNFCDLDNYIERKEGKSVTELFAIYKETGFREREQASLKDLVDTISTDTIIACGGGTPCFFDNLEVMKNTGKVIYLETDVPALLENIKKDGSARPLLPADNTGSYLQRILANRKFLYEQADVILPIKDITLATFAEIIASCINKR